MERNFTLSVDDIARINPNTKTAPIFRARADAALTAKVYARVPVLVYDATGAAGNPWDVEVFTRIWNMTEDAAWFRTARQLDEAGFIRDGNDWVAPGGLRTPQGALNLIGGHDDRSLYLSDGSAGRAPERYVPLYEAKMIHQFDHRWATHEGIESRDATISEKQDPRFEPTARYWVPKNEVTDRLATIEWTANWLMGWRNITSATNERTSIFSVLPRTAVGNTCSLIFVEAFPKQCAALLANLNSFALDFVARVKVGGTHLTYGYLKQFPVLPPAAYTVRDLAFIVPRVLELTYTGYSMAPFARDLGYDGPPFGWDEDRRAELRAELDAWYARAYGLTRDELRYVLDPAGVKGPDYPSETFRVLKKNEIARFGEYRTGRLVLAAYDQLASQPVAAE
jgi:hypothetical protein